MTPGLSLTAREREHAATELAQTKTRMLKQWQQLSRSIRENADYVGDRFAEELAKSTFR